MTPALKVIEEAGGIGTLARILKVDRTWVWRWCKPKNEGGTGGNVPQSHHCKILAQAKARGWKIKAEDLINDPRSN